METTISALLLDISGVLYEGRKPVTGAAEALSFVRRQHIPVRFVTNTASRSAAQIIDDLSRMGIEIGDGELYTAPLAARDFVVAQHLRPYVVLHESVMPVFDELEKRNPNAVVLGDAREALNYQNLNQAFRLCKAGAPLIAVGMNKYFSNGSCLQLDAGPFVHALAWASGRKPVVIGKPSARFFQQVAESTGVAAQECMMIGDDVQADVAAAIEAGLQGCLVRTGKYQQGDEAQLAGRAPVIDSIADLASVCAPCYA